MQARGRAWVRSIVDYLKKNPPILIFIIGVAIAAITATGASMAEICRETGFDNKAGSVQLGCLDFWLNRYQTMLAVVAAVVTAIIYGLQLRSMNESRMEMEKARSVQVYDLIVRRSQEIVSFDPVHTRLADTNRVALEIEWKLAAYRGGDRNIFSEVHNQIRDQIGALGEIIGEISDFEGKYFGGPELVGYVSPVVASLRDMNLLAVSFIRDSSRAASPGYPYIANAKQSEIVGLLGDQWAERRNEFSRHVVALGKALLEARRANHQLAIKLNGALIS